MSQRVDTILLLMSSLFFGCIENAFFFSFFVGKKRISLRKQRNK